MRSNFLDHLKSSVRGFATAVFLACVVSGATRAQPSAETSTPAKEAIDQVSLEAFFERLRDEPPLWTDAAQMAEWLSPYGQPDPFDPEACNPMIMLQFPQEIPGFGAIIGGPRGACAGDSGGRSPSITMQAVEDDDAAEGTARRALEAVFGSPQSECSDDVRTVWAISDDTAAALVSPFYPSFAILIVNAPITDFDCDGNTGKNH